jgi:hypothetical protein
MVIILSISPQFSLPTLMMLSFYSTLQKTAEHLFTFHSHFITTTHVTTPFAKNDLKRAF